MISYSEINNFVPVIFEGKVIDSISNRSVQGAYVHLDKGGGGVYTAADGSFCIKTFQKLPVGISVKHCGYRKQAYCFNASNNPLKILLTPVEI
jgi:hypothetical protein